MKILRNIALSEKITMGIGGIANYWLEIEKEKDVQEAFSFIKENQLSYFILGEGSNTIGFDSQFPGAIVHPVSNQVIVKIKEKEFQLHLPTLADYQEFHFDLKPFINQEIQELIDFYYNKKQDISIRLIVDSGVHWDSFVYFCILHGISGIEFLSGIPGKVGATPIQNVGAYGKEVKDWIEKVYFYILNDIKKKIFHWDQCKFSYRNSIFKGQINTILITQVEFRFSFLQSSFSKYVDVQMYYEKYKQDLKILHQIDQLLTESYFPFPEIKNRIRDSLLMRKCIYDIRKKKGMILEKNHYLSKTAGSFFMNPILTPEEFETLQKRIRNLYSIDRIPFFYEDKNYKIPAAWLIEFSGFFKGYKNSKETFMISPRHALSIIQLNGKYHELKHFVQEIQKKVFEKTEILLKPEPIFMEDYIQHSNIAN